MKAQYRELHGSKLTVEGDWSPRLREVDIIEHRPTVRSAVLRAVLEFFEVKVNLHDDLLWRQDGPRSLRHALNAPLVVLNVQGARLTKMVCPCKTVPPEVRVFS